MSTDFENQTCVACRAGAPTVSDSLLSDFLDQHPDWTLIDAASIPKLERSFKFKNFAQALEFTNRVGTMAEAEQHHPAMTTEWGAVTVQWWTHKIKGLHENDLIAAAKTDQLFLSA